MIPPRILFAGNSHLAAIRLAYVTQPDRWPGLDPDFFGLPGRDLVWMVQRDGMLRPGSLPVARRMRHYALTQRVDLRPYEAFVIVGGVGVAGPAAMTRDHRPPDAPSVRAEGPGEAQLVPEEFIAALLARRIEAGTAARLAQQLDPLGRPTLVVPEPLPARSCAADPDGYGDYVALVARGDAADWAARVRRVAQHVIGAPILNWLDEAREDDGYTAEVFMRGSVRLDPTGRRDHAADDHAHANAVYGALVLDQIAAAIG